MLLKEIQSNIAEIVTPIASTVDTDDQEYPRVTGVVEAAAHTGILPMIAERHGGLIQADKANIILDKDIRQDRIMGGDNIPC